MPFRIIYSSYALLLFVGIMFLIIPFVIIGSFWGRIKGGNFIYRMCIIWGDIWFFLVGIRHTNYYEVPHDKTKHYIFVANHTSFLDAAVIVKTLRQKVRPLGKVETSKIPFFGFIYRKAIVTVDRSNPENRAKSVRVLKSVLRKGISIFIFPEGTFNLTGHPLKEFYDGAFRIAIETQTAIKPILFLDVNKRLNRKSLFSLTPGRTQSVFLAEIGVEGLTLKDVQWLKQKVYDIMEEKLTPYHNPLPPKGGLRRPSDYHLP